MNINNLKIKDMEWEKRLYFGTWQLSNEFDGITPENVKEILNFALKQGVINFDTAHVYGNGFVEELLGNFLPKNAKIITKIPAISKPIQGYYSDIKEYYPKEWLAEKFELSMKRLKRNNIYGVLLHNWSDKWENDYSEILSYLLTLKINKRVKKIGISIPNGFKGVLPINLIKQLDIIEAPYNYENDWVNNNMEFLKENNIEIILRSIFLQGKHCALNEKCNGYEEIIKDACSKNCSLVIGMTKKQNIINNIKKIKEEMSHEK